MSRVSRIKAIIFDFTGVIYKSNDDYDEDLLEYMAQLRKSYKIGMITNLTPEAYETYVRPIKERFDDIVVASHVGIAKPSRDIYLLAAYRLGLMPEECVFVDDYPKRCEGAEKAGMKVVLYKNFEQLRADLKMLLPNPDN